MFGRVPDAAQHEVMRRRAGTQTGNEVPALRRIAKWRCAASGTRDPHRPEKEKGRMLRTSSLVLLIFSRPWGRDHIPTPPARWPNCLSHLCTNCAGRSR